MCPLAETETICFSYRPEGCSQGLDGACFEQRKAVAAASSIAAGAQVKHEK
jgi:hypothetical protein